MASSEAISGWNGARTRDTMPTEAIAVEQSQPLLHEASDAVRERRLGRHVELGHRQQALVLAGDGHAHQVVEVVEVAEQRPRRQTGALGDLVGRRVEVALAVEREHRVDDGQAVAVAAGMATVLGARWRRRRDARRGAHCGSIVHTWPTRGSTRCPQAVRGRCAPPRPHRASSAKLQPAVDPVAVRDPGVGGARFEAVAAPVLAALGDLGRGEEELRGRAGQVAGRWTERSQCVPPTIMLCAASRRSAGARRV